jgi:hypothetical protein
LKWEEAHKFDGLDLRFLQNKISFYFELFYWYKSWLGNPIYSVSGINGAAAPGSNALQLMQVRLEIQVWGKHFGL